MVKCCVFFEVRTEYLNIIKISFCFRGLITANQDGNFTYPANKNISDKTYSKFYEDRYFSKYTHDHECFEKYDNTVSESKECVLNACRKRPCILF
jgi:hypothetical protein